MKKDKLLDIYNNLFYPINNKDYGKYWKVSYNKSKPLANAEALLRYVKKEDYKTGNFINRYANLENDLILENNIFLDFDLTAKTYLKNEKTLTDIILKGLVKELIAIEEDDDYYNKNSKTNLKQVQKKFKKDYTVKNGYCKGFNSFIDGLTEGEAKALKKEVSREQEKELKGKKEKDVQQYYINTFEKYYLEEPFKEATTVAKYFESLGIKTVLNWSGSKGLHLRIPITTIDFIETDLEDNPENVKIFLNNLAELIETKLLNKPKGTSSLDYQVFCKGMQRIPTSKHNKTKLYANFIDPSANYLEAIDYLKINPITDIDKLNYFPEEIDTEQNTKLFLESDIYKATLKNAIKETTLATYDSEVGNIAYNFKSEDHKKLKEIILEIYPESVNFFPYKVIHLLKRTGFSKEEVEAIFRDIEPNKNRYNKNIKGNIKYTFENPNAKICGLKNLIEWIENKYPNHEKDNVINYFKTNFEYYEKPIKEEKVGTAIFKDNPDKEIEVPVYLYETKYKKYLKYEGILEGIDLTIDLGSNIGSFIYSNTGKEIDSFKFKFNNKYFEISKPTFKELTEYLAEEEIVLPKHFEKNIRKSLKSLDKSITKPKIIEESIVKSNVPDGIVFGETEESYYQQTEEGIEHIKPTEKGYISKPIANVVIKDVTIILDSLGLFDPVYNVTYYNKTFNKEVTVKYKTKKQLIEEFIKANVFYHTEAVETVLNTFIIDGSNEGRIETKTEAYLEGYFYINGKVVANTPLNNIKKPTKEDVAEAITLLNEIMKDRTAEGKANDSAVYRFKLWNPFSYCLKQLGYAKANYSLIEIGDSQTNKTGASKVGDLFYNRRTEETSGSTVSVLGSKIGEGTFSTTFDECNHLFKDVEGLNVMKRAIYETTGRAVKDRNDNTKIDEFPALNLPAFILNPDDTTFKDYIRNRYKIINYTSKSFISSDTITKFIKEYLPESEDTILNKLAYIGYVFSEKIIAIIEDKDRRKELMDIEGLTIEILKEIATEVEVNFLPEMCNKTEVSNEYDYDVKTEIVNFLNEEFKNKNMLKGRPIDNSNIVVRSIKHNDFPFIFYNQNRNTEINEKEFIINMSQFKKYLTKNLEENVSDLTIIEALDLEEILQSKQDYEEPIEEYVKKGHKIKIIEPSGEEKAKTIAGIHLKVEELATKVFSLDLEEMNKNKDKEQNELKKSDKVENEN